MRQYLKLILKIQEQLKFYEEYFDHKLYARIKDLNLWKRFSCNNTMLMLAINCQFKKINSKLSIIDKKIAIMKTLHKLTKHKYTSQNFTSATSILNNETYSK